VVVHCDCRLFVGLCFNMSLTSALKFELPSKGFVEVFDREAPIFLSALYVIYAGIVHLSRRPTAQPV
jgi:hypothetical protein